MSLITLNNIEYKKDNNVILQNIVLQINEGDCISIVGKSGSGKSTLLKVIASLITPSSGIISYKDISYNDYSPILLRREISYSPQTPLLFGSTILDNLSFPFKIRKKAIDNERINYLLNLVKLDKDILEKDINSISGGEKQRISLIRNLLFLPKILLLDEITSSLDKDNAIVIEDLIKQLNKKGITVLWVTHNTEESMSIFSKRITMDSGIIQNVEELK